MWHSNLRKNKASLLQAFVHTMIVGRIIDCIHEYPLYVRCHFILYETTRTTIQKQLFLLSNHKKKGLGEKKYIYFCFEIIKSYFMS